MRYIVKYYPETNKISLSANLFNLSVKEIKRIHKALKDVGITVEYIGEL